VPAAAPLHATADPSSASNAVESAGAAAEEDGAGAGSAVLLEQQR